jgi:hypothetical protein
VYTSKIKQQVDIPYNLVSVDPNQQKISKLPSTPENLREKFLNKFS